MAKPHAVFYAGTLFVFTLVLFSCSSSNKDKTLPPDPKSDSVFTNIGKASKSPVDSINYYIACVSYWSGRLQVTATNVDANEIVFQHDYERMPSYVGSEENGKVPASTYWLNRHQFVVIDRFNYTHLGFNYNMWSVVDVEKRRQIDQVIRTGANRDTTYCSFPYPWYENTLIASVSHKGQDEAIVYDAGLNVKYKTEIGDHLKHLEFLLADQVLPLSYDEFIDFNAFPELISRTKLDGTFVWKSSVSLVLFEAHLANYTKPVVTATEKEVVLTVAGQTKEKTDTTVVLRLDLRTGKLL